MSPAVLFAEGLMRCPANVQRRAHREVLTIDEDHSADVHPNFGIEG